MCGIAGFAGNFDGAVLARMGAAIAHRGPDASGDAVYTASGSTVGLVNRRLAIQDLSPAGRQPMTLQCPVCGPVDAPAFAKGFGEAGSAFAKGFGEAGSTSAEGFGEAGNQRLWLTFNGEIYNFPELRRELEQAGHRFFSRSDSEVILHLYTQHGVGMLPRLNGIFGLAIYDGRPHGQRDGLQPGDVLLARDGVGVKPLYYSESAHGILFASEMKALLACGPGYVDRAIDPAAISQYLAYQWVPAPRTVLESVRKVRPGEYLVLRRGRIASKSTFYKLPAPEPVSRPFDDLVGEFQDQLRAAVTRQLLSDVPIGAFLSGGLDSSAVVAMVRQAQPGYRLPCYTMAFDDDFSSEGSPSDLPFARQAARHLGVDLIEVHAGPRVVERLDEVLFALDEPTGDPAPINAYLISERAHADGLKVLLSGTGGDDILAGYPRNQWLGLEAVWDAVPMGMRRPVSTWARSALDSGLVGPADFASRRALKLLGQLDQSRPRRLAARLQTTPPALRARLLHPALRPAVTEGRDVEPLLDTLAALPTGSDDLTRMLHLEQRHFLADHNLNYLDKTTMAFSVEGRVPLLDLEFVEFAAAIPSALKVSGTTGKYIFKKAMEPFLPRDILYRGKAGFGVPLRRWMTRDLRDRVRDTLSSRTVRERGVFDDAAVQRLMDETLRGETDGSYPLFSLLAFETWCRRLLDAAEERPAPEAQHLKIR
jgi:asparagine synthase (glutamine-hydrolysing)